MKKNLLAIILISSFAATSWAQTTSAWTTISSIRTGWNADQVAIILNGTIPNPAGCSMPDGIILNTSTPGYKTHYATILAAMMAEKEVAIAVANTGCILDRPIFWGISLK